MKPWGRDEIGQAGDFSFFGKKKKKGLVLSFVEMTLYKRQRGAFKEYWGRPTREIRRNTKRV